jgi:hypothetical protein
MKRPKTVRELRRTVDRIARNVEAMSSGFNKIHLATTLDAFTARRRANARRVAQSAGIAELYS